MTVSPVLLVEAHRIAPMGVPDRQGERHRVFRYGDQMDVVGHQAVAQNGQAVLLGFCAQSFDVEPPVFVEQEDVLAVVAPLGDVMRTPSATTRAWRDISRCDQITTVTWLSPISLPGLDMPAFSNPRMILKRVWVGKSAGVGSDLLSRGQGRGGCEGAGGRSSGACSRSAATFLSMGLRSPRAAVSLRAQPGRREPGGRAKVPAARRPPTTASGSRPAVLSCAAASAAHIRCRSSGLLAAPEKQP